MDSLDSKIEKYWREKAKIAQDMTTLIKPVKSLVEVVCHTYFIFGKVFVMGNGGGASAAEGFAIDLATHPFVPEDKTKNPGHRSKLEVHCLSESAGLLSGISNDLGIEHVFVEQLMNYHLDHRDLLIAFSGSGNSENIIKAIEYANERNTVTSCISGRGGGRAAELVDNAIIIPGTSTFPGQTGPNDNNFHIEDFQVSISHIVTGLLKEFVHDHFKFDGAGS